MNQELKELNETRWKNAHIPAAKGPAFKRVADVLMKPENRAQYQYVSDQLKKKGYTIPWWFIAVAHYREAGFDEHDNPRWDTYLGNGQPLDKVTTIVPKGRGPFSDWGEGAIDALVNAPPYAAKNTDWSIGGALTKLEEYNGMGYFNKGKPSPYLWAGTDQYVKGKYTSDGVYNSNAIDKQLGCAGILKFMGVFKTPVGLGTTAGAGGAVIASATSSHWWNYFTDHWVAIVLGVVGVGIAIDLGIAIYNDRKNRLKVNGKAK
jgi:lysozyme family protein